MSRGSNEDIVNLDIGPTFEQTFPNDKRNSKAVRVIVEENDSSSENLSQININDIRAISKEINKPQSQFDKMSKIGIKSRQPKNMLHDLYSKVVSQRFATVDNTGRSQSTEKKQNTQRSMSPSARSNTSSNLETTRPVINVNNFEAFKTNQYINKLQSQTKTALKELQTLKQGLFGSQEKHSLDAINYITYDPKIRRQFKKLQQNPLIDQKAQQLIMKNTNRRNVLSDIQSDYRETSQDMPQQLSQRYGISLLLPNVGNATGGPFSTSRTSTAAAQNTKQFMLDLANMKLPQNEQKFMHKRIAKSPKSRQQALRERNLFSPIELQKRGQTNATQFRQSMDVQRNQGILFSSPPLMMDQVSQSIENSLSNVIENQIAQIETYKIQEEFFGNRGSMFSHNSVTNTQQSTRRRRKVIQSLNFQPGELMTQDSIMVTQRSFEYTNNSTVDVEITDRIANPINLPKQRVPISTKSKWLVHAGKKSTSLQQKKEKRQRSKYIEIAKAEAEAQKMLEESMDRRSISKMSRKINESLDYTGLKMKLMNSALKQNDSTFGRIMTPDIFRRSLSPEKKMLMNAPPLKQSYDPLKIENVPKKLEDKQFFVVASESGEPLTITRLEALNLLSQGKKVYIQNSNGTDQINRGFIQIVGEHFPSDSEEVKRIFVAPGPEGKPIMVSREVAKSMLMMGQPIYLYDRAQHHRVASPPKSAAKNGKRGQSPIKGNTDGPQSGNLILNQDPNKQFSKNIQAALIEEEHPKIPEQLYKDLGISIKPGEEPVLNEEQTQAVKKAIAQKLLEKLQSIIREKLAAKIRSMYGTNKLKAIQRQQAIDAAKRAEEEKRRKIIEAERMRRLKAIAAGITEEEYYIGQITLNKLQHEFMEKKRAEVRQQLLQLERQRQEKEAQEEAAAKEQNSQEKAPDFQKSPKDDQKERQAAATRAEIFSQENRLVDQSTMPNQEQNIRDKIMSQGQDRPKIQQTTGPVMSNKQESSKFRSSNSTDNLNKKIKKKKPKQKEIAEMTAKDMLKNLRRAQKQEEVEKKPLNEAQQVIQKQNQDDESEVVQNVRVIDNANVLSGDIEVFDSDATESELTGPLNAKHQKYLEKQQTLKDARDGKKLEPIVQSKPSIIEPPTVVQSPSEIERERRLKEAQDKKAREDKDREFEQKVFSNMDKQEQIKMDLDKLFLNEAMFQIKQPINIDEIMPPRKEQTEEQIQIALKKKESTEINLNKLKKFALSTVKSSISTQQSVYSKEEKNAILKSKIDFKTQSKESVAPQNSNETQIILQHPIKLNLMESVTNSNSKEDLFTAPNSNREQVIKLTTLQDQTIDEEEDEPKPQSKELPKKKIITSPKKLQTIEFGQGMKKQTTAVGSKKINKVIPRNGGANKLASIFSSGLKSKIKVLSSLQTTKKFESLRSSLNQTLESVTEEGKHQISHQQSTGRGASTARIAEALSDHDWASTPLFYEHDGFSEMQSLKHTVLMKRLILQVRSMTKQKLKDSKEQEKLELKQAYESMKLDVLKDENQMKLAIKAIKRDDAKLGEKQLKKYFNEAKITLEVLMAKQSLEPIFKSLIQQYNDAAFHDVKEPTLKMLYRCLKETEMISKVKKIFDMIKSKHIVFMEIMTSLDPEKINEPREDTDELTKQERNVIIYCLNFMNESSHFKDSTQFIFEEEDVLNQLKTDIHKMRMVCHHYKCLQNIRIPTLNEFGFFDKKDQEFSQLIKQVVVYCKLNNIPLVRKKRIEYQLPTTPGDDIQHVYKDTSQTKQGPGEVNDYQSYSPEKVIYSQHQSNKIFNKKMKKILNPLLTQDQDADRRSIATPGSNMTSNLVSFGDTEQHGDSSYDPEYEYF